MFYRDNATTRHLLVLVVAGLAVACSPPRRTGGGGGNGGGGNGGGGSGGSGGKGGKGGSGGGGGGASSCSSGNNFCDGANVRECDAAGKPGAVVETCAGGMACSNGRCTSPECASAESKQSVVGCLFYGADTDNTSYDDTQVFGFPVGNPGTSPTMVKIQRATGMGTWMDVVTAMVPAGEISYLRIAKGPAMGDDYHIELTGQEYKGYRIEADTPIVAYDINADDENGASGNSGSTLLLPIHALGRHYYAITPPDMGLDAMMGSFSPGPSHSFIEIIGTRNLTKVDIKVTGATLAGGSVPALSAGDTYTAMLNEGEALNIETAGKGNDLTGSEITSDKPVSVYAGNVCGGFDPMRIMGMFGSGDCDHIEEMMYPVNTWGKDFVVIDLRMNAHQPSDAIWARVLASEDDTHVTFDAPRTLSGLPTDVTLMKGEFAHIEIKDPLTMTNRAHFNAHADKPVMVESFMGVQEGGAVTIPVDQFLDDYLVSAHPWFTGYLMVTRTVGAAVTLDGAPMPDKVFTAAGGGYEVSYVAMPRCETDVTMCGHRIVGAKVGVSLTANGGVCNYCYAGGAGARCVNKTAGCQ